MRQNLLWLILGIMIGCGGLALVLSHSHPPRKHIIPPSDGSEGQKGTPGSRGSDGDDYANHAFPPVNTDPLRLLEDCNPGYRCTADFQCLP